MRSIPAASLALALFTMPVAAQQTVPVEAERDTAWYTVSGERHGLSYFPRVRHEGVEYEAGERLTFDRFHTVDVVNEWLRRWAERYPEIMDLYEIGRSFEGRPIMQVTLTNKSTGAATTKPAAFFEGGRHSGEITASESVLWLMQHLLENYGRDARITALLDTKAIHLRVQNNPDGSNLYLHTAQANRSSVRPHDSDRDGLFDEDPNEDLDGDGAIYQMRWRPRNDDERRRASMVTDPRDPSGRLLRRVEEGKGEWMVASEGIDNDRDGRFNEDGIGGLDLHRNYPENWRHDTGGDDTGRGYTQFGAGEAPLSEPETRSVVLWLLANPNISVANSMDTRVPMHLRPPSTSRSADRMYPEDLRYYEHFDTVGMRITGYPWAGDVYETYATRWETNPVTGDPLLPGPLFGHGPDFGYFYYGSIWYGDELWNGGMLRDVNGDGRLDDVDALAWDDSANGGRGFRAWTPFEHPELGTVEIGGFHPKFFSQNPPAHDMERWARNQALFNFEMAYALPQLEWGGVDVRRVGASGDSATYEVTVSWRNSGRLPTALKQAQLVKIVQEDRAQLRIDEKLTRGDGARVEIIDPQTRDKTRYTGWTEPGETKRTTFRVRVRGGEPVPVTVRILSTRGGLLEREIRLGS